MGYLILAIKLWTFIAESLIFRFNERKLKIWIAVVSIWSILNLTLLIISMRTGDKCRGIVPVPIFGSCLLLDFIAIILNTYLFTKPLYTLYQTAKSLPSTTNDINEFLYLKEIARKQWILSILAVGSSM